MADDKEIKIKVVADAEEFRKNLKDIAGDVKSFNKMGKDMQKEGMKGSRFVMKMDRSVRQDQAAQAKELLGHEKKLQTEYFKKLKLKKELAKAGKAETEQARELSKELRKISKETQNVASKRMQLTRASRGRGGAMLSRAPGMIAGGLLGIGGAALGAVAARAMGGVTKKEQLELAQAQLFGSGASKGGIAALQRAGGPLGFRQQETTAQAAMIAKLTGNYQDVTTAQMAARSGMVDFGQVAGTMGIQAQGGIKGAAAKKELEKLFSTAVSTGVDRSRMGEVMGGATSLMSMVQGRTGGTAGLGSITDALAALGSTRSSGLTGARGVATAAQLDKAIRQPGGGAAGDELIKAALGFTGGPGGKDYYSVLQAQERGFLGQGGVGNLQNILKMSDQRYGSREESNVALKNVLGIDTTKLDEIRGAMASGNQAKVREILKSTESLDKQSYDVLKTDIAPALMLQIENDQRLLDEGEHLSEQMQELNRMFNSFMHSMMEYAIPAIQGLFMVVKDVAKSLGVDTGSSITIKNKLAEAGKLRAEFTSGNLTGAEYYSKLKPIKESLSEQALMGDSKEAATYALKQIDDAMKSGQSAGDLTGSQMSKLTGAKERAKLDKTRLKGLITHMSSLSNDTSLGAEEKAVQMKKLQAERGAVKSDLAQQEAIVASILKGEPLNVNVVNTEKAAEDNATAMEKKASKAPRRGNAMKPQGVR